MKTQIKEKLESSKIAVYGNDEGSERFIEELRPFFSDIVHLTDFTEEMELQPFSQYGIETVWLDDYKFDPDRYIVITGQFIRSQNKLKLLRFEEYIDYASIYVVRAIIQRKKLVVTMGTAAMSQLTAAMKVCSDFSEQYTVKYYNNKNFFRGDIRQYQEYQHVAKISDVYIYSVRSVVEYQRSIVKEAQMKTSCIRIGISGNDFNGFHPQLNKDNYLSKYCFREYEMSRIPYKYYVFSPLDIMMEHFIKEKLSKKDIMKAFRNLELLDEAQIRETFEMAIAHIRKSDELADIPLAEKIIELKSKIVVSRSLEEWHPEIIAYMLDHVFKIIGHEETQYCYDDIAKAACEWSGNEIPVYPCVLKFFGLEEAEGHKIYRIVSYKNIRYMDIDEYAEYFADYCVKADALYNVLHFSENETIANVLNYLEHSAYQYGSKGAFSDGREFIRYYQLRDNARSVGSYLIKKCVWRKQPIAVLMRRSVHSVVAFFGIVYSGNFYCPIDENLPMERMKEIMDILKPKLIIADVENMKKAEALGIPVISYTEAIEAEDNVRALAAIKESMLDTDPVYVLFNSDFMETPKSVSINHRTIINNAEWIGGAFDITNRDVIGNQAPFYLGNSAFDIYTGIRNGCTVQIIPKWIFAHPAQLLAYLDTKKVTTVCWMPRILCTIANTSDLLLWESDDLKKIFFCGEIMPNKQLNIWRAVLPDAIFVSLYGMAEFSAGYAYYVIDRVFEGDEALPIGNLRKNISVLVLDKNNKPVEGDEIGEICVQNSVNMQHQEIICRTGDLGRYNERNELIYMGRMACSTMLTQNQL